MKTTKMLAILVLALVVGLPAGVAKADDGAEWLDVRYDDEAYCLLDCYMDGKGNLWMLWWNWQDRSLQWEYVRLWDGDNVLFMDSHVGFLDSHVGFLDSHVGFEKGRR